MIDSDRIRATMAELRLPVTCGQAAYHDRTPVELIQEASIRVMQAGALRLQVRCRRLELRVDRLEHELAAARDEADRLRAASEHAQGFLRWGLDADQG
jgi:hypothetical protein